MNKEHVLLAIVAIIAIIGIVLIVGEAQEHKGVKDQVEDVDQGYQVEPIYDESGNIIGSRKKAKIDKRKRTLYE